MLRLRPANTCCKRASRPPTVFRMKITRIFLILPLAACATEFVPLNDTERAEMSQAVQDEFTPVCIAQGEDPAPNTNTGCLARIAAPVLQARINAEEKRRFAQAESNRVVMMGVAGVLAAAGAGMSAYGAGYAAAAPVYYQPPPTPRMPISCFSSANMRQTWCY